MMKYVIGVDVGTGSVRAALVQSDGKVIATETKPIRIWNPHPDFYEQSSEDIWEAVVFTVKSVVSQGGAEKDDVVGMGFDATCSLVVMDGDGKPLSVSPTGLPECNIIMWMDHRASKETDIINATKHEVLKYTGGAISVEMEPPKLMWLKKNLRETCWNKAGHFFDLCDFLTWRATGSLTRSQCSVVAKWTYTKVEGDSGGFSKDFYSKIGLEDLTDNNYQKIGNDIQPQGRPCGSGLSAEAASDLQLNTGMAVGIGQIDAHCGAIGCLGCVPQGDSVTVPSLSSKMALISGTSTCHMAMSEGPLFVPGVWGPFWSTIIPGLWSAEGGQSAAGKLIDFIVETHPAFGQAKQLAQNENKHIHDYLSDILEKERQSQGLQFISELTRELHIWPDYHGNRSPIADHTLKGMVTGLTLRSDVVDLAMMYLATVQALAYGTKHIISEMLKCDHTTSMLYICGGLRKNPLYVQMHADVTGLPVIVPNEEESVLLGAGILGATAAGLYPTIQDCMEKMCGQGQVTLPSQAEKRYHEKKFAVFLKMLDHQREYKQLMNS